MNRCLLYIVLLLVQLLHIQPTYGQSLLITDCQGFTRAAKSVKPNSLNRIEVNVSDVSGNPLDNVQVSLTNSATGEVSTVTAKSGVAAFENVAPGAFSVSSSAAGVSFSSIAIAPGALSTLAATGIVAGGAVASGGAATGVVIGATDAVNSVTNNNSDPDPTPTPIPPTPTPIPTVEATPTIDCQCNPDAEPTPIDDFFKDKNLTPTPISPFS
ncbi:MAG: carboxypeptidase-like regulatory domain-containing protein [Oligoflexia bacterium]|nr:carboxypeptidase-like regulatory domain-containing protein [Oligoflexia bacterium]